ncbi:hypothetical protein [Rhizobium miluonense]|uniref:Uncharacterized protein n=1 Tax=Rhizobium miluonense TaxID=411945 RepID=A0A1C3WQ43_9HYPH|nr:hypothetical protein [Rhizobium miluonense]SCB41844.1 hypothetical protein GA0061102_103531 [Rhizobium miluonense]
MTNPKPIYHSELQCSVFSLSYDFVTRQGVLNMAETTACDMNGCIAFFQRIDPKVQAIQTKAGNLDDTSYLLVGKEWKANLPPRKEV